ncbi:hypothetical protein ACF0H5_008410 [Mactra antiquata]
MTVVILCLFVFVSKRYKDLHTYSSSTISSDVEKDFTNERSNREINTEHGRSDVKISITNGRSDITIDGPASNKDSVVKTNGSMKFTLLTAYMRSGSTFLGSLLGIQSNIFYFYEPLHKQNIFKYVQGDQYCSYTKPECELRPEKRELFLDFLTDLYNCTMVPHEDKLNVQLFKMLGGPKWQKFSQCMVKTHNSAPKCLKEMENECKKYEFRSAKVLRMGLDDAAMLLNRLPNLRLIHLFRDPRAVINSHIHTGWFPMKSNNMQALEDDIKALCSRLDHDTVAAHKVLKQYPDRIKIVQYDDLYGNITKLEKVFEFTGMPLTPTVKTYIKSKIGGKTLKTKGFHPAASYRGLLSYPIVQMVDKHCENALQMLGLRSFSSVEELRNVSISHINDKLTFVVN